MKTRNFALDGIRGYAVLLVFMVHFWGAYSSMPGHSVGEHFDFSFSQPWQSNLLFYGQHSHYGVDLFFVLSGFLIASILQSPSISIGRFVFNRALRIYPAFLLSFVFALFLWKWSFGQAVELSVALKNIFFLNGILF